MSASLPIGVRARLAAFRLFERLGDLRGNAAAPNAVPGPAGPPAPAWWVFVSTIGELNAVAPLLDQLCERLAGLSMVLVSDHAHYRDSYLKRYPQAEVCITLGHSRDAAALAAARPPRLMVVAEIPLLLSDAPCRCSAALLLYARAAGARLVAVNGWLYGYAPSCRMDAVERRWLQRALLTQFDVVCVQTDAIRDALVAAGAPAERLHVAGNLKLDALHGAPVWSAADARNSPRLLQALLTSGRPVVVAGSLTRDDELQAVLDAFAALRRTHPRALLVLALRHPEVPRNLEAAAEQLARRQLPAVRRSQHGDQPLADATAVLVLDTMGELRDLYAISTVAHVGVDHNVLEPLCFGKPTSVMPGWNATYPSFPVYVTLDEAGVLLTADGPDALRLAWQSVIDGCAAAPLARARAASWGTERSLERHMGALLAWL